MRLLTLLILLAWTGGIYGQTPDFSSLAPHPRLLLRSGGEDEIRRNLADNPAMERIHHRILDACEQMLQAQPVVRIKEGKRLLAVSRTALKRIFYLSYAWRMTGNERYCRRAEQEMLAASAFTDWNPTHFLDVGEMTMALAIGYDWLYDQLSPQTRRTVCRAILDKGFAPAEDTKNAWFYRAKSNWNQVCNGGLLYGALAVYEEAPREAARIVERCLETNPLALESYAPQGGYPEGYGYWGYGTSFQVMLIAALESALGSDFGLSASPGFMESAVFMQMMCGPGGRSFNFSDAPSASACNMMMFWFADKMNDPSVLWMEKSFIEAGDTAFAEDRLLPCLLLFGSRCHLDRIPAPKRHFWHNDGPTPVYIYRSGWESPSDTYLGIKGGSPSTSHAHMDAGSFIFQDEGVRWAMDLGMQEYYSLESKGIGIWKMTQNSQRWDVFRIGPLSHNILTANGHNHAIKGFAPIVRTFESDRRKGAVVDLTALLGEDLRSAERSVTLDGSNHLTVEDRIETGPQSASVRWSMCTPAKARIIGRNTVELESGGRKRLLLVESSDGDVAWKIWPNDPPPHDYDVANPGTLRVGFETRLPANRKVVLRVTLRKP